MTQPDICDLVLYRTIVDSLYRKAISREHRNVYFKREKLQRAQDDAAVDAAILLGNLCTSLQPALYLNKLEA
jgi:hypothetical protein